jgi:hypothetical protein
MRFSKEAWMAPPASRVLEGTAFQPSGGMAQPPPAEAVQALHAYVTSGHQLS